VLEINLVQWLALIQININETYLYI
jgi:hypothetical protein